MQLQAKALPVASLITQILDLQGGAAIEVAFGREDCV